MSVTISITLTDVEAARVVNVLPANTTVKQLLIAYLINYVRNVEQAAAAQQAQATVTTINPA